MKAGSRTATGGSGRRAGLAVLAGCLVLMLCSQLPAYTNLCKPSWQESALGRLAGVQLSGSEPGGDIEPGLQAPASPASLPPLPLGVVGPRLQPWVHNRSCLVYILDGLKELAPYADVAQCNISDPKSWPHSRPGNGTAAEPTRHCDSQHAGPWWLTQALYNATGILTTNLSEACMVWLDMDCYNTAFISRERGPWEPHREGLQQMLELLMDMPRFKRHNGRDFAVAMTHPALRTTTWASHFCSDRGLRHGYHILSEFGLSCYEHRRYGPAQQGLELVPYNAAADVDLSKPVVGSRRPTFICMQAACRKQDATHAAVGPRMRDAIAAELGGLAPDLQLSCPKGSSNSASHVNITRHLRHSLFCTVVPGETPSSPHLAASVLAGCIPVFIGPPWHVMPLHRDIDWASMGVFINITSDAPWLAANETAGGWQSQESIHRQLQVGKQTADVAGVQVNLPDLRAAYNYLRAMPQPEVEQRQAALDRERYKFYYPPGPSGYSQLADIVLANMLEYGAGLQS